MSAQPLPPPPLPPLPLPDVRACGRAASRERGPERGRGHRFAAAQGERGGQAFAAVQASNDPKRSNELERDEPPNFGGSRCLSRPLHMTSSRMCQLEKWCLKVLFCLQSWSLQIGCLAARRFHTHPCPSTAVLWPLCSDVSVQFVGRGTHELHGIHGLPSCSGNLSSRRKRSTAGRACASVLKGVQ